MERICLTAVSAALALSLVAMPAVATSDRTVAPTGPAICEAPLQPWTEINLYLGRNIAGVGEVTEQQFRSFVRSVVTPRFPDGLTIDDALGQFHDGKRIVRERTKQLVLLVPDSGEVAAKVESIVNAYKQRFQQQSVLRTETALCLSFD